MPSKPLLRRLITVPTVVVLWVIVTGLAPVLVVVAASVDSVRWMRSRKPFVSLRALGFGWVYLLGQVWALIALAITALLPKDAKQRATFRLQASWASWNFTALRRLFSLGLEVTGSESVTPGPIVLLVRHASIVDTLLPANLVARPHGLRLRYVLKRELLVDPTLDIGGNRLPNHFISRGSGEAAAEIAAIQELASGIGDDEGILIYPEGTRFTEEKQERYLRRFRDAAEPIASLASGLRKVLPPRPGGTLAILESTTADVVVLAHRGLEGLATVADIWRGGLVGSRIEVELRRVPRDRIPGSRPEMLEWLYRLWADVDAWVAGQSDMQPEVS